MKLKCLLCLCSLFASTRLLFFCLFCPPSLPSLTLCISMSPVLQNQSSHASVMFLKQNELMRSHMNSNMRFCVWGLSRELDLGKQSLGSPKAESHVALVFHSAHFTRCLSRFFFFPLWVPRAASVCSPRPASTEIPGDPVLRRGVSRPPEAEEAHHGSCEFPVTSLSSHTLWSSPF